jgi:NADH-quinone oxidoreductase subunit A
MTPLVGYLLLFIVVGIGFVLVNLLLGKVFRPARPNAEKMTIYECGEPTIGSAWVQFDLRYYVVALLFVIFDVEVAFFFPWAVVFGQANTVANENLPLKDRAQAYVALLPPHVQPPELRRLLAEPPEKRDWDKITDLVQPELAAATIQARSLGWVALADILVFFGVLLVGFAYLWKRGDLAWVRSTAAEKAGPPTESTAPPPVREGGVLVGAGHE